MPAPSPTAPVGGGSAEHVPALGAEESLRALYRQARQTYATFDGYTARMRRREQVNGKDKPEEVLLCKFRKEPFSVHFKWVGAEAAGREVVYVSGHSGDVLHTLLAAGDMPLVPAGRRLALRPDNIFVRAASRHSITEAGLGRWLDRFALRLAEQEKGDQRPGSLRYLGLVQRPEFDHPLEGIEQLIPAGVEPQLAKGGRRYSLFDSASHLPVLTITQDSTGKEVEYYCYEQIHYPVHFQDADFDPDQLWASPRQATARLP
jgi:hypothetical protein